MLIEPSKADGQSRTRSCPDEASSRRARSSGVIDQPTAPAFSSMWATVSPPVAAVISLYWGMAHMVQLPSELLTAEKLVPNISSPFMS